MSDPEWTELVDRSPLLSVLAIGKVVSRHAVRVEFIALERRELGGVLTFVVVDETIRETGEGPLIQSVPLLRLTADDGRQFETRVVGGTFLDMSLVRYQAVFRPPLPPGTGVEVVVDRFVAGTLADVEGPWASGVVTAA